MNDSSPLLRRATAAVDCFRGRPGTGIHSLDDVLRLLDLEFPGHGRLALEQPVSTAGGWRQALAPRSIYHVLASNLSVSAEVSLFLGWILGARLYFKLPASGLPDFQDLVHRLPADAAASLLTTHDPVLMNTCDAIVAFGSDESIAALRAQIRGCPRFLTYGSKISLLWLPPGGASPDQAALAAADVAAFQQLGCLSPQACLCADPADAPVFAAALATALRAHAALLQPPPALLPALQEFRLRAHARGDQVWEVTPEPGPTVILPAQPRIEPGPGCGCIAVLPAPDPAPLLEPWRGHISTLSIASPSIPSSLWSLATHWRIPRLCPAGQAQNPPLHWLHDGRPRLADLVSWTAADPALPIS